MPLARRSGGRFQANIWPGFVDAMTALLLVLFFVLSIFMIVQFVLRETITGQDRELDEFSAQIAELADALGLEQQSNDRLSTQVNQLGADLTQSQSLVATLSAQQEEAEAQLQDFEAQVAGLLADNRDLATSLDTAEAQAAALTEARDRELSAKEALELALAQARDEVDAQAEEARLAAARREALAAMVADLRADKDEAETALTEAERNRVVDAAAAEALRSRLRASQTELTALTLNLEAERKRAEETLTLLAAAETARDALQEETSSDLTEAERQRALLAQANQALDREKVLSAESQRRVALLNQQTAQLRTQLNALQGLLDEAQAKDAASQVQLEALGQNLNTALARVAAEERRRAELEAQERARLEAEAANLESYRSEFFGRVREILGDREGVRVVGDRFVFSSEVLFDRGSAQLGQQGRVQLANVADVIREIAPEVPDSINWILRVDGHTDNIPLSGGGIYADNWELSQARALSVVKYLISNEGIPADRLAANGFGEFQPIDGANTADARARNRRIELKFTER